MHEHRTAAALEARRQYAADRAIDDPIKLARSLRVVRTALARKRLRLEDLVPDAGAADAA